MSAKLVNSAVPIGLEKVSFHSNPQKKQCQKMFKIPHNYTHITHKQNNAQKSPSQASIVCKLPDVQAGFRKARGTRDQIANMCYIIEKTIESSRNISTSALLTMPKPLTVWITINCGTLLKRWEYQAILPTS